MSPTRNDPIAEGLRAVELFEGLSGRQVSRIAKAGQYITFKEGDPIVLERFHGGQMLVILEGSATVRRGGRDIATLGAGDFFGEMGVLGHVDRSASVIARSRMKVLAFEEEDLERIMQRHPEVARRIRAAAAQRTANDAELEGS